MRIMNLRDWVNVPMDEERKNTLMIDSIGESPLREVEKRTVTATVDLAKFKSRREWNI